MLSLRRFALAAHVAASWLVGPVLSRRHHVFVANLHLPAALHSIVFDEETAQLNITRTIPGDSSHSWLTFNACVSFPSGGEARWQLTRRAGHSTI